MSLRTDTEDLKVPPVTKEVTFGLNSLQRISNYYLKLLRGEIKKIINEVLDERELNKKMKGPYDVPEEAWPHED